MVMKRKIQRFLLALAVVPVFGVSTAYAQYNSSNYRAEEAYFGIGADQDAASANYRSSQSVGAITVGGAESGSYKTGTGFLTPQEPFLEMTISGAPVNLGILSSGVTARAASQGGACTCSFSVRTYLSGNYVVKTMSGPPTNDAGQPLATKITQGASIIDTEEFGMNLVANTSPANFGANPVNRPDSSFADGAAGSGLNSDYATTNQFKYIPGDTIAHSAQTSGKQAIGQTDYTISYIANVGPLTKAGLYTLRHDLVVIATY